MVVVDSEQQSDSIFILLSLSPMMVDPPSLVNGGGGQQQIMSHSRVIYHLSLYLTPFFTQGVLCEETLSIF